MLTIEKITDKIANELISPCFICGKVWRRCDAGLWFYVDGKVLCRHHKGVTKFFEDEIAKF